MAANSADSADAANTARRARRGRLVMRYAVLTLAAAIVLFPIYITLVDALLSPQQVVTRPPTLFPLTPHWGTFATAFKEGDLGVYLRNSAIVTTRDHGGRTVDLDAGRLRLRVHAVPGTKDPVLRVPGHAHGAVRGDDHPELPDDSQDRPGQHLSGARAAFHGQRDRHLLVQAGVLELPPRDPRCGRLDGCGHVKFLFRMVAPINRPVLAAFSLFAFLSAWNQYLWPLVVTQTNSVRTVQIGLRQLSLTNFNQLDVVFAGTILATLPIALLLFVFQRQLVAGLTAGAVKG